MQNQQPVKDKSIEDMTLQEYTDQFCEGDRYRAIYDRIHNGAKGSFDRYIEELSPEEARFALQCVERATEEACGGAKNFAKAIKAETLAVELGVDTENLQPGSPNPFTKKVWLSIAGVIAAILIAAIISVTGKDMDYLGEIFIGLASVGAAGNLVKFFQYQKLKKWAKDIPTAEAVQEKEYCPPPFEAAIALFRQTNSARPAIEKEDAQGLLCAAGRQIVKSLLWMLLYVFAIVVCFFVACGTGAGGIIGTVGLFAFFVWQMVTMFRVLLRSKAVGDVQGVDSKQKKSMETRQGLLVVAGICVAAIYLLLMVVGCFISVMVAIAR